MIIQENSTLVLMPESELQNLRKELSEMKSLIEKKSEVQKKYIPKSEAAKELNVSVKTLDKYFKTGELAFSQFKGKIYVMVTDIEAHLDRYYVKRSK